MDKPQIAIDISSAQDQFAHRGVGNYTRNITLELLKQAGHQYQWHLIGFGTQLNLIKDLPGIDKLNANYQFHSLGKLRKSTPLNFITWWRKYRPLVKRLNPDLYFCPEFQRGAPVTDVATVTMVHDVIPVITGSYSPKGTVLNAIKGYIYRQGLERTKKSKVIITNSNFSKQEIVKALGIDPELIHPIYLATTPRNYNYQQQQRDQVLTKYELLVDGTISDYITYNGGLEANKNAKLLISAFDAALQKSEESFKLVFVGKEFERDEEGNVTANTEPAKQLLQIVSKFSPEVQANIHFTGFVSDDELAILLSEAKIFVHLSEYEGFGLSILEAMEQGVPTIAANSSCYPEVAQDGALLVDLEIDAIVSAITKLLTDDQAAQELAGRGQRVAAKYSWRQTAADTLEVFADVLNRQT